MTKIFMIYVITSATIGILAMLFNMATDCKYPIMDKIVIGFFIPPIAIMFFAIWFAVMIKVLT